jgi:uncharacterized damage-inducible protein DinB
MRHPQEGETAMRIGITVVAGSLLLAASRSVGAQVEQQGTKDAGTALKAGFAEVSAWVTKSAELVPAEKYSYRPVGTVRTFGQVLGHVADAYNYYCSQAAGKQVQWSDAIANGATDKATILPKLKQAGAVCDAVYASGGAAGPLLANVGHTSLHYGNLITYLRMMGMVPPSS